MSASSRVPADNQRSNLGDSFEVAIHVNDPQPMVEGGLCDEEVRDGDPVPHAMTMGKVALEPQRPVENVGGTGNHLEAGVERVPEKVIVASRAR